MSTLESTSNCTFVPEKIKSGPNIAGIGVLLSFITTAAASILFSCIIIWIEFWGKNPTIIRKMLLSLSDQQIVTGIGSLVLGLWEISNLTYYHFFTLWMLSLLSTVTHVNTLLALANEIKSDWVMRWLRQFFIFINFALSFSYGIIIFEVQRNEYFKPTLSIVCLLKLPSLPLSTGTKICFIITVIVIAFQIFMFVISICYIRLHFDDNWRVLLIKSIGLVIFSTVGIMATFWIIKRSDAFNMPVHDLLSNRDEEVWDFGQLLPMLLLILPVISAIELYCETVKFSKNILITEEIHSGRSTRRSSFEPNPFWGK